jgi:hypothetical protein
MAAFRSMLHCPKSVMRRVASRMRGTKVPKLAGGRLPVGVAGATWRGSPVSLRGAQGCEVCESVKFSPGADEVLEVLVVHLHHGQLHGPHPGGARVTGAGDGRGVTDAG